MPCLADPLVKHGIHDSTLAYLVMDPVTGADIEVLEPKRSMIPASTAKLVTALAALDVIGPEATLATELGVEGTVSDGVLEGSIVLRGGGDVELDVDDLMELALSLRGAGIGSVRGRFLVDDSAFLRVDEINPRQPVDAPYNAGIGPLALAFSRVTVRPHRRRRFHNATAAYRERAGMADRNAAAASKVAPASGTRHRPSCGQGSTLDCGRDWNLSSATRARHGPGRPAHHRPDR